MSLQKKYYYKFSDIKNQTYTVELWQNTGATITASEVVGDEVGFNITYPQVQKLETVRGSGCDLSLLSQSNMQFIDLYTVDSQEYMIKFYLGTGTTNLLWTGYLDSEIYSESFSYKDNYQVKLTGNDGLAILNDIYYLQSNGSRYSGFTTNWSVITTVLGKIGLTWNNIYCGLSTTSSDFDGQIYINFNVLEHTYSYQENYYDEENNPMTCRQVLETILKPFGAFIIIINGNVYITDNNHLLENGTSNNFYKYSGTSPFSYIGIYSLNTFIDDLSNIQKANSDSALNILPPINKQNVIFSQFASPEVINWKGSEDKFTDLSITNYLGSYPYTSTQYKYTTSEFWSSGGLPIFGELIGTGNNEGVKDKYLIVSDSGSYPNLFTYNKSLPNIVADSSLNIQYNYVGDWIGNPDGETWVSYSTYDVVTYSGSYYVCNNQHYPVESEPPGSPNNSFFDLTSSSILDPPNQNLFYLKIESKGFVRTKDSLSDENNPFDIDVKKAIVMCKLKIGSYTYSSVQKSWVNSPAVDINTHFHLTYQNYEDTISDKWVDNCDSSKPDINYQIVPLYGFNANSVSFVVSDFKAYNRSGADVTTNIKDIRLKELKISIVDANYNEIKNEDIEYTAYANKLVKEEGEDIRLNLGSNVYQLPYSKGAILKYINSKYWFITNFTRNGLSANLEELLTRTIRSNNPTKTYQLDISVYKDSIPNIFGYYTYNNFLSSSKLGLSGAVINFNDSTIDLNIQEIFEDTESISKNYL